MDGNKTDQEPVAVKAIISVRENAKSKTQVNVPVQLVNKGGGIWTASYQPKLPGFYSIEGKFW